MKKSCAIFIIFSLCRDPKHRVFVNTRVHVYLHMYAEQESVADSYQIWQLKTGACKATAMYLIS